jgi:hypothetical protein
VNLELVLRAICSSAARFSAMLSAAASRTRR